MNSSKNRRAASVVAFAGHMIDAPGRAVARFPAALEPAVQAAIRRWLAPLPDLAVYASAACGADLLFVETALELDAEVNIVLPFDARDFVRTSVAPAGAAWCDRFDKAIAKAAKVTLATEGPYLGDDRVFEHAARLIEGLAILRAARTKTPPRMLCVLDRTAQGGTGGTLEAFDRWQQLVGPPDVIDLAVLRAQVPGVESAGGARSADGRDGGPGPPP